MTDTNNNHISYSMVDIWLKCPRKYKFRYIDNIKIDPEIKPDNPILLGKAFDIGTQYGYKAAEENYLKHFPIITDELYNWLMQIEYWLPKIREYVKDNGKFQVDLHKGEFVGYADYIDDEKLIDFKFSNNGDLYAKSPQVILYADCLDPRPRDLMYICAPKTVIRQKQTEDLQQFRKRLLAEMESKQLDIRYIEFDPAAVKEFYENVEKMREDTEFIPIVTAKCDWCEYREMCEVHTKPKKRELKPYSELHKAR